MALDDRSLVERCIEKDPAAWDELVKKYSRLIDRAIEIRLRKHSFTFSPSDVSDIHQHLLTSIWDDGRFASIRNRDDITYWLAMAAGNAAIDHMRQLLRHKTTPIETLDDAEYAGALPFPALSHTRDPRYEAIRSEIAEQVRDAMEILSSTERLIAKMSLMHGKTHAEIASIMNIPEGTVSSSIKRSKEKLRSRLQKYMQDF